MERTASFVRSAAAQRLRSSQPRLVAPGSAAPRGPALLIEVCLDAAIPRPRTPVFPRRLRRRRALRIAPPPGRPDVLALFVDATSAQAKWGVNLRNSCPPRPEPPRHALDGRHHRIDAPDIRRRTPQGQPPTTWLPRAWPMRGLASPRAWRAAACNEALR